ncbi:Hypothetical protein A7982_11777 [Minicystis rosea]|nr:Hypothetical protein A7982_11777 [Minicystis rosea]
MDNGAESANTCAMPRGSGPPRAPPKGALRAQDPYRAFGSAYGPLAPGSFPEPGGAPPSTWPPTAAAVREADGTPSRRRIIVNRFDANPPRQSLLAAGVESVVVYGDAAGEHHLLARGRHDAWAYVYAAFLGEVALFGALPGMAATFIAHAVGMGPNAVLLAMVVFVLLMGAWPAWAVFRDRWYCIEAQASRYCVGLPGISWLHVPAIAFVYANFRGLKKLTGG